MKLAQEQSAKQVLSVSMQQSLQILQMPLSQLQSYLTEQLLGNPLAEMEIQDPDAVSVEEMMEIRDQFDFLDDFDSFDTSGVSISDIPFPTRRGETLSEHLLAQLNEDIHLPREYLPWCSFLVKNLDRRGYLDESMDLLAAILDIPLSDAMQALYAVQSLSPTGVGARNLQECLLLQLAETPDFNAWTIKIITQHLGLLSKNNIRGIATALGIREADALRYCNAVRRLNPIPAQGFSVGTPEQFVFPEALVEEQEGSLSVHYNRKAIPRITENRNYASALLQADPGLWGYLKGQQRQIEKIRSDLSEREHTVVRILEEVLGRQRDYLLGRSSAPLPMTLHEVASALGLHPSTVSRAVQEKYVTFPIGTLPLRQLFSQATGCSHTVSKKAALSHLRQLIEAEDKSIPLSDESLRQTLSSLGIVLSRRSVAAHREELGIPAAYIRKRR